MNLYTMSFFHPYGGYYTNNSQRQRYYYYYENNMQQSKTVVPEYMQQSGGDEDQESGKVPNIVQSSASIDRTQMARVLPPVMVCSGSVAASSNDKIYTNETSGSGPVQLRCHLLDISEVVRELEKLQIAVEEKIRKHKKVVKQYEKKLKEVDRADAWDVIRIMVTEEHRINRTFNTLNEFLDHWFYTCHGLQEDSKLEAMYRKDSNGQKERGSTGVQEKARERYRELKRTDKAIYRAVAKQYFKKRLSIAATDNANECDLEFREALKAIGNVFSDVIYRPN